MSKDVNFGELADALRGHETFVLITHVRPDGDAIGSQLALGAVLEALDKRVLYWNEDGLPDNLRFLPGAERIVRPPSAPVEVDVVLALDTATRLRLGEHCLAAVGNAKLWINVDHHVSNPRYGDWNLIQANSPATGEIIYDLIVSQGLPFPAAARDAIYVAVSTDTGSFQYSSTTAHTYEMAADLVRRGVDVGRINSLTYNQYPFRRLRLMRALLDTVGCAADGRMVYWELSLGAREALDVKPEDSEGLIDVIRAIEGVMVAVFFEELADGRVRVSMRSKDPRVDVNRICAQFGGGGHAMAAGSRMQGSLVAAKARVIEAVARELDRC